jgi:hypothetical protein
MVERLRFNIETNGPHGIAVVAVAVAVAVTAGEGEVLLGLNARDAGVTALLATRPGNPSIIVSGRPLVADAGITRIDALKIDIEGAEDEALMPFLAEALAARLPGLLSSRTRGTSGRPIYSACSTGLAMASAAVASTIAHWRKGNAP